MWGLFFRLSGGKLGWAESAVGTRLCGCIRSCQGVVRLGTDQRGRDRDKAGALDCFGDIMFIFIIGSRYLVVII